MADNKDYRLLETIVAVVIGISIHDWIIVHENKFNNFPWLMLLVGFFVIGLTYYKVKDWLWERSFNKGNLNHAKQHGYESWPEYMAEKGIGEDTRESWKEAAEKERAKKSKQR